MHPKTKRMGGPKYCSVYDVLKCLSCYGKKDHTDPVRGMGACGGLYSENREKLFFP